MMMNNQCKHNWKQVRDNERLVKCLICGEIWDVERLVNYLQGKVEELQEETK
jgi:hypothetical protein